MVKSFLLVFFIICFVFGICELIYIIRMFFAHPDIRTFNYSIIVLKKGYAVSQLNFIYQKIRWYGDDFSCGIIGITDLLDASELELGKKYIKNKNKIILCELKEISQCEFLTGGLFNG